MYKHIIQFVADSLWAITEEKMDIIASFLSRKVAGENISAAEIALLKSDAPKPYMIEASGDMDAELMAAANGSASRSRAGNVAVLPLYGTLSPKVNLLSEMSGGTSMDKFMSWFRAAQADDSVRSIVIDVDSPGGSVRGIQEAADEIFKARGNKPVIAQVTGIAASAAYWIASQADKIIVTPSGSVGSIGVFARLVDDSEAQQKEGIKVEYVKAGKYKTELEESPITDEAKAALQEQVDEAYDVFTKAVARGRDTRQSAVKNGYGEGRVLSASKSLEAGMVDKIAPLTDTLARFGVGVKSVTPTAEANSPEVSGEASGVKTKLRQRLLQIQ